MVHSGKQNSQSKKLKLTKGLLEEAYLRTGRSIIGIDEVGRGCLAGPIYAACVALDYSALDRLDEASKNLIRDSKTLSSKQRQKIIPVLDNLCREKAIGIASVGEIEEFGIVLANFKAMFRAFEQLKATYDLLLIDGNQLNPLIPMPQDAIIGGDGLCFSIASASIFAKEARDTFMREAAATYPNYDFDSNVGYGTKSHLTALIEHGITPLHRRNFSPIQRFAEAGHFANITPSAR